MARPAGRNGKPRKFYISDKLYAPAQKIAFSRGLSASQLVSELLRRELARVERKRAA